MASTAAVEQLVAGLLSTLFPSYSVFIAGQSRTARVIEGKPAIVVRLLSQRGEIYTIGSTSYLKEAELEVSFYYVYRESNYSSVMEQARSDAQALRMALLKNPNAISGYLVTWVSSEDYSPTLRHPGLIQSVIRLSLIGMEPRQQ
jgi:hypothetical protein